MSEQTIPPALQGLWSRMKSASPLEATRSVPSESVRVASTADPTRAASVSPRVASAVENASESFFQWDNPWMWLLILAIGGIIFGIWYYFSKKNSPASDSSQKLSHNEEEEEE